MCAQAVALGDSRIKTFGKYAAQEEERRAKEGGERVLCSLVGVARVLAG
jgi:hypothetical protein